MEKLYWVIGYNKWSKNKYTKKEAKKYAATLINCINCIDCIDCSNCRSCSYCSYCLDCRSCSYCSYCLDFKTNPERIISPEMGSRNSQTTYYWNKYKEQIVCGCFTGTLQEFENQVLETHKDNEHSKKYLKWIEKIKIFKEIIK